MIPKCPPYAALEIANWFLVRSKVENTFLRHMKLQKLVYFAYGWCYAYFDQPLFAETIYAYRHGPVVKEVYDRFRDFGGNPIMEGWVQNPSVDAHIESLLDSVWKAYAPYSDIQLSDMTHTHPPWIDAYRSEECFAVMSPPAIRDHFKNLRNEQSNTQH